jgi:hypothetical protein
MRYTGLRDPLALCHMHVRVRSKNGDVQLTFSYWRGDLECLVAWMGD